MKPIPLASPDGLVYAYACGECHHVRSNMSRFHEHSPKDVAEIAACSLRDAERCCACRTCGARVETGGEHGMVAVFTGERSFDQCVACWTREAPERAGREAKWAADRETNARERAESLSKALDRDAALRLEAVMRDISETNYCAGWMSGLEHTLWHAVETGPHAWGMGEIAEGDIAELRRLSEKSGGWWVYDRFVPLAEWLTRYDEGAA